MRRKLPPFPANTKSAVVQVRRGARTVTRSMFEYVEISERYTYYKIGKFQSTAAMRRRTAMRRGKLRKHVERWLGRIEELLAFDIPDALYRAVRRLVMCAEKILYWCERIPRKDYWPGDPWCQRLGAVVREIVR